MEFNKGNIKKLLLLITFGVALYWCLQNLYRVPQIANYLGGILTPILLGLALAFILNVLMFQVETRLFAPLNRRFTKIWPKFRRPLCILLTFIIILGIFTLILLIIIPQLVNTITNLTNNIPPFFNQLQIEIQKLSTKYPGIGEYFSSLSVNWSSISEMLATYGRQLASLLVGSTVAVTANVFKGAITSILSLVIAINILAQKEKLQSQLKRALFAYLPIKAYTKTVKICRLTNRTFSNFIAGQVTEACILGTLCFIGMCIFRFPYALLISVLVVFMALIPIIGAFFSVLIGALLILTSSPITALWFILYFVILQQIEGNLIYPRVVGSKIGLPALWVLVAVTIGGNAFGVIGMLINIPLCSVLYVLLRENVNKRLGKSTLFAKGKDKGKNIKQATKDSK